MKIPVGSHGIVYVRVSTAHQAEDELPIESQIAELTAAVERAGATCEVVKDAGISGTDYRGRPGLQSIASRAREAKPGFAWVLVWKLSRFGRDLEEGLVYRALLRRRGIELISHKEPIPEGPLGTLITHVLMAVDQFYAAATAADVLRSQKELARQGFSAGGRPPVGYRREPVVLGARYDGSPLTRVRFVPDPEMAPRVVQAFQMAADGVTYEEIVAATGICRNKSSLATILANPIYRGVRLFNRETRVEGEHGRKRRRNPTDQLIESEVEPIVPEPLWHRVETALVERRANRLPPQRRKGAYVLTELLRCSCGSGMAGTCSRVHRYYRCTSRCGRPTVRADQLESSIFDLIRRSLITPDAIRQMVEILNSDLELRSSRRSDDHDRAISQVRSLERQDANLRRALRTAAPSAAERISVELDSVAGELREATRRVEAFDDEIRPYRITKRLVQELLDQMSGLIEHAPLETRVAWVRDLFEQVEVDGVEQRAVARWKAPTDQDVGRLESVTEWLRRAGAGRLLIARLTSRGWHGPCRNARGDLRSFSSLQYTTDVVYERSQHQWRSCADGAHSKVAPPSTHRSPSSQANRRLHQLGSERRPSERTHSRTPLLWFPRSSLDTLVWCQPDSRPSGHMTPVAGAKRRTAVGVGRPFPRSHRLAMPAYPAAIAATMTPIETPALRLSDVARRLAISRAAAYRLVRSGQLRGIRVGQTWRVLRADFDAYVDERRAEAERRYREAREEA